MCFFNTTTITYALAYFLPVILTENMGFSVGAAQCLVAPPYAFAGIVMFAGSWVGDRYRIRGPIVAFNSLLCIIGLPIMGWHPSAGVRYFGVFLVTAGANADDAGRDDLPSQQHPGPVETSSLQRYHGWLRWYWRNCGKLGIWVRCSSPSLSSSHGHAEILTFC